MLQEVHPLTISYFFVEEFSPKAFVGVAQHWFYCTRIEEQFDSDPRNNILCLAELFAEYYVGQSQCVHSCCIIISDYSYTPFRSLPIFRANPAMLEIQDVTDDR